MSVDLQMDFDTTESMTPCIREVRRRLSTAFPVLFERIPDLRIGMIAHGDYCDGPRMITDLPFTNDVAKLQHFVDHAPNTNGGDSPECYELILRCANEHKWRPDAKKAVVMIGDDVPHPSRVPAEYGYGHIDWQVEAKNLAAKDITLYTVQALYDRRSEFFWRDAASYGQGKYLRLEQFGEAIELLSAIAYHREDPALLPRFAEELKEKRMWGRAMANAIATLSNGVVERMPERRDGLVPVPPSRFQMLYVPHDEVIKDFVADTGAVYRKGRGFYELTKSEIVQKNKEVILRDKKTGDFFSGSEARHLLGLPDWENIRIRPVNLEQYDVFIQSNSYTRILKEGQRFLYEANKS